VIEESFLVHIFCGDFSAKRNSSGIKRRGIFAGRNPQKREVFLFGAAGMFCKYVYLHAPDMYIIHVQTDDAPVIQDERRIV
jgi:hypothetical protein